MTRSTHWAVAAMGLAIAIPLVLAVVVSGSSGTACAATVQPDQGITTPGGGRILAGYSAPQLAIARTAVAVGEQRGATPTVIISALMAAMQESGLRNLANDNVPASAGFAHDGSGRDYDSVGPWQMRASIWGSAGMDKLMSPVYQADWFFDRAARVQGADTMDPGELAQRVEISDSPDAYTPHRQSAEALYQALRGAGATDPRPAGTAPAAAAVTRSPGCGSSGLLGTGSDFGRRVVAAAQRWLGTPYVWGGGDPTGPTGSPVAGFDCSGLSEYAVYVASGGAITLAHYTGDQVADPRGKPVPDTAPLEPGDLIFFGDAPDHVAIFYDEAEGRPMVLNAPDIGQNVKIEPLADFPGQGRRVRRFGDTSSSVSDGQQQLHPSSPLEHPGVPGQSAAEDPSKAPGATTGPPGPDPDRAGPGIG